MKRSMELKSSNIISESPMVSIIVPVYQVKDYVGECVESLLSQTYQNLEILLVDDGSSDGSGVLCDEYAVKDERVRVIHQENQGPSVARNQGLDCAKGEFVAFVDADDVVMPSFIETLYGILNRNQADIAACAFVKCKTDELAHVRKEMYYADRIEVKHAEADGGNEAKDVKVKKQDNYKELCMTSERMLRQWHGKYKKWETVVWNKLYRKSVLNGENGAAAIRFPIGRKLEDVRMSHLMVANAAKVVLTTRKLYLYRIIPNSRAVQSRTVELGGENLRAQRERMAFFKERRYWRAYLNLLVGYLLHLGWFGWKTIVHLLRLQLRK